MSWYFLQIKCDWHWIVLPVTNGWKWLDCVQRQYLCFFFLSFSHCTRAVHCTSAAGRESIGVAEGSDGDLTPETMAAALEKWNAFFNDLPVAKSSYWIRVTEWQCLQWCRYGSSVLVVFRRSQSLVKFRERLWAWWDISVDSAMIQQSCSCQNNTGGGN